MRVRITSSPEINRRLEGLTAQLVDTRMSGYGELLYHVRLDHCTEFPGGHFSMMLKQGEFEDLGTPS